VFKSQNRLDFVFKIYDSWKSNVNFFPKFKSVVNNLSTYLVFDICQS